MPGWTKGSEQVGDGNSMDRDSLSYSDDEPPSAPGKLEDASARSDTSPSPLPPHQLESRVEERSFKQRMRSLVPKKLSGIFGKRTQNDSDVDYNDDDHFSPKLVKILPNGTRVSPPVTPYLGRRWEAGDSLTSSKGSQKPLISTDPSDNNRVYDAFEGSELTSLHAAEHYAEKLEVYRLKYSYLKSWPGLLRLLAGLELLFGGMVFACICAYIQKDSEWSNYYMPTYFTGGGYSYNGPMTPFVMAVLGVAWLVTIILLVLGMTMYYRTILLDSPWWPVTEGLINVALFLLYMAAGIVYVNDLNRGGLCYMIVGVNPIMSSLCRVDGGQMAGTAFLFINMIMYLLSFLVCLKMWRHEATRRAREALGSMTHGPSSVTTTTAKPKSKRIAFQDEMDQPARKTNYLIDVSLRAQEPETLRGAIPTGYVPRPRVIPDYIIKYPEITKVEDREQYKAVFNDQYQEYKELHKDIISTLAKFRELDTMMNKLLSDANVSKDQKRINQMLKKYEQKKNDPSFLEKKERCEYLKAKLTHIKSQIKNFDEKMSDNS